MKYFYLLMLSFSISALFISDSSAATKITLSADEWCPYNCNQNATKKGYMVELAQAAFEAIKPGQYEIDYINLSWSRSIQQAKAGEIDGIIGALESEAEGLYIPQLAQGMNINRFYTYAGNNWRFSSLDNIRQEKIKIGVIKDYDYDDNLTVFIEKNPDLLFMAYGKSALGDLVKALFHHRIDALIEDQYVFLYYLNESGYTTNNFRSVGKKGDTNPLFIAFHEKKYSDILDQGTRIIRKNGDLAKILRKYGLRDWVLF
ncbi:MAG: transporter substrate-binding domain-containing protein [Pseudomonadales bacterium]|nr:transporter substrate-binding domain-containing protein [Pseudomonadales bacterium]